MKFSGKLLLSAALAVSLSACASTDMVDSSAASSTPPVVSSQNGNSVANPGSINQNTIEYFQLSVGDRVFFGTDQYSLNAEAQQILQRQASWLANNPGKTVTIEGHADERGTRAYNLALGASRADSVRNYLISLGIQPSRLTTVSYGKERPVETCSNESCWFVNRRAVTVVLNGANS